MFTHFLNHTFHTFTGNELGYNKPILSSKLQVCLSITVGCFSDEQSVDSLYHLALFKQTYKDKIFIFLTPGGTA